MYVFTYYITCNNNIVTWTYNMCVVNYKNTITLFFKIV